ncbi:hypothetical protein C2G38_2064522 [Gigaspora rosea]|uniref:Uncharacterized protein n=1 Tax=Gigaspora rosea TaxID=44941 RepID=A0A397VXC0_9GLOM|nr:hypothetical protein C2G38_2064522 [Gigaspora rosea]
MDTAVEIHPKEKHFTFDKIPGLTGKVAVVTGGNAGIGYITCRELARKKCTSAIEKIKSETGNQNIEFLHLNLKSSKSVKECAENFLAKNLPLHILFYLRSSQPARIVNVSSRGHLLVEGGIELEKLSDPNAYDAMQRYALSKLANILFTNELNKQYLEGEQIYANSLHPGLVDTQMLRRNYLSFSETFLSSSISTEDGAITTLYCAMVVPHYTSPEIEEKNYRGMYFDPFGIEGEKSSCAKDYDLAKKLWEFTENLINEILSQE